MQARGRRSQGADGVRDGLQHGPPGDDGGGTAPGSGRGPNQFCRRPALAARLEGGGRIGPTESEPRSFQASGTACSQAAAEGISSNEKTAL